MPRRRQPQVDYCEAEEILENPELKAEHDRNRQCLQSARQNTGVLNLLHVLEKAGGEDTHIVKDVCEKQLTDLYRGTQDEAAQTRAGWAAAESQTSDYSPGSRTCADASMDSQEAGERVPKSARFYLPELIRTSCA